MPSIFYFVGAKKRLEEIEQSEIRKLVIDSYTKILASLEQEPECKQEIITALGHYFIQNDSNAKVVEVVELIFKIKIIEEIWCD